MQAARLSATAMGERVGMRLGRTCTDCVFLLVYLLSAVGFMVLAVIAADQGNPLRLLYGTDYLGNVCGRTSHDNAPRQPLPDAEWVELKLLWYPFDGTQDLHRVLDMGVCVSECPREGAEVVRYPDPTNTTHDMPPSYSVKYASSSKLRRCVPGSSNSSAVSAKLDQLVQLLDVSDVVYEGVSDLEKARDVLVYSAAVAFGMACAWLLLVYCCALPMVLLTAVGVIAAAGYGGKLAWDRADDLHAEGDSSWKIVRAGAVVSWVCGGLFLLMCVFLFKKIVRGSKMASAASRMLMTSPSILMVPLFYTSMLLGWIALCVLLELNVETMTSYSTERFNWAGSEVEGVVHHIPPNKMLYRGGIIFFFLWTSMLIIDLAYMSTAMAAGFWYFSGGEEDERGLPLCGPFYAALVTLRYHVGTVAFGSLVISIVKFIRWIFMKLSEQAEKEGGGALACIAKMLTCCLCCVEKCLKFLCEKAYVVTAVEGKPFLTAALRAISLVVANVALVAVAELVSTFMMLAAKLLVVGATAIFAYLCLERWDVVDGVEHKWFVIVCCAVLAYLVVSLYVHVFGTVLDTIVLSRCIDKDRGITTAECAEDTRLVPAEQRACPTNSR